MVQVFLVFLPLVLGLIDLLDHLTGHGKDVFQVKAIPLTKDPERLVPLVAGCIPMLVIIRREGFPHEVGRVDNQLVQRVPQPTLRVGRHEAHEDSQEDSDDHDGYHDCDRDHETGRHLPALLDRLEEGPGVIVCVFKGICRLLQWHPAILVR